MAFRGYFSLDGVELANSSRTVAHLGTEVPTADMGVLVDPTAKCDLTPYSPGLWLIPASSAQTSDGLWTPPNGSRRFGPGLMLIDGECWGPVALCPGCRDVVTYDDSWQGLQTLLGDPLYRPELAPWYSAEEPDSAEFGGVWVMRVDGLGPTPVERTVTQLVGSGAVAGPSRDAGRTLTFDALLIACTNAGVEYGLRWLACRLRRTADADDGVLRYLAASPSYSQVNPSALMREVHGTVLTAAPAVTESFSPGGRKNQQGTVYRVTWEMATLSPYAYMPSVEVPVDWDEIVRQPVNWIHAADCYLPETCQDMPVLFALDCVPEEIAVIVTPPPVCGGCLPVGEIDQYTFRVPTMDYAFSCRETAVSLSITNTGERDLTAQFFWRYCNTDIRCEDNQFPLQVTGLPPGAELILNGINGRFHVNYDERARRPVGMVATPNGAPWRPPLIDRHECWDFIAQTASDAEFTVTMVLSDREA